jgi:tungstate transport system substrate-binding protein
MKRYLYLVFGISVLLYFVFTNIDDEQDHIILQATTSTDNSGFFTYILPLFEKDTSIRVDVVAVGTGQAIKNAKNGDGDLLLVHEKELEEQFVADGYGSKRFDLMFNDFILVGPVDDPANVRDADNIYKAFEKIYERRARFVSRGDNSGTHIKELKIWNEAGIRNLNVEQEWYFESGNGMGATLNMAVQDSAYTLCDRSTWISFKNKSNHTILLADIKNLINHYGIVLLNENKYPKLNHSGARKLSEWLLSKKGQSAIAGFKVNNQQMFFTQ